ncbi:MAG: signal transduction histidine kinase/CheY-like chemotaxis protein [Sulfurimonas sp.]|jgi:signal transduction histidine kinase/CheY-like chemotaxis protein|uniref:ATP-binding protein n=1 Tax=Sulfurimonas sp. TaxID=2022749 RepID=UPI0039E5AE55
MHSLDINLLLSTFNVTQEDAEARNKLHEVLPVISSVLIQKFYREYLKDDKEVNSYFKYINIESFLEKVKEFIIFIYSAPLDQYYVERISKVGYIHAEIKLDNAKVKYAFFGINQLLYQMSSIDPLVKSTFSSLSKLLAMTEHIIITSTQHKRTKIANNISNNSSIWMLDKIYSALSMHKENYAKVENFIKSDAPNLLSLDSIVNNPSECKFHYLLENFEEQSDLLKATGINLNELKDIHSQWHKFIANIKQASKEKNVENQKKNFDDLTDMTNKLYKLMDKPLKEFSTNAFLSLSAGLKAINSINFIFSKRELPLNTEIDIQTHVIDKINKNLQDILPWAIKDIQVQTHPFSSTEYNVMKRIKYKEFNFYIAISFQPLSNKLYLTEILILLLEALELNLSIKERELSLIEYAEKAESANRAKDVFLSSMSHELRTPLTAVNGYSEILMRREDTPENIKGYLKKINIAGNNLLELVNTILDFARLEAGKMKFNPSSSSIYLILQEVEMLSIPMAQQKNITLNVVLDLHLYLMLDAKLFKQVLLNLISNAIKFTPEHGEVQLNIGYDENEKGYKFSVCDTGVGISQEDQKKLFNSFTQIDNVYQKSASGSGLGLMICKKIIEKLHHGRIWVESELGKGSCFHVMIPTLDPVVNSYCIIKSPKDSKHLLIVEDSHTHRTLLQYYLEEKFKLTFTNTNNGAKHILSSQTFDMIILDFYLEDGISSEVLKYMEDENINIPVVVLSAEHDLSVAKTIYVNNNIESILDKKYLKEFCKVLNPDVKD